MVSNLINCISFEFKIKFGVTMWFCCSIIFDSCSHSSHLHFNSHILFLSDRAYCCFLYFMPLSEPLLSSVLTYYFKHKRIISVYIVNCSIEQNLLGIYAITYFFHSCLTLFCLTFLHNVKLQPRYLTCSSYCNTYSCQFIKTVILRTSK